MNYRSYLKRSVRYRVKNVSLTEKQFRELVENHLRHECKGLFCDMYADYTPDKGLYWDTLVYDAGTIETELNSGLNFFAERYLKTLPEFTGDVADYVSIAPVYGEYLPKEIRRKLSKEELAEYMGTTSQE